MYGPSRWVLQECVKCNERISSDLFLPEHILNGLISPKNETGGIVYEQTSKERRTEKVYSR